MMLAASRSLASRKCAYTFNVVAAVGVAEAAAHRAEVVEAEAGEAKATAQALKWRRDGVGPGGHLDVWPPQAAHLAAAPRARGGSRRARARARDDELPHDRSAFAQRFTHARTRNGWILDAARPASGRSETTGL